LTKEVFQMPTDDYDDDMEYAFREVTQGSEFEADESEPSGDPPLQPLCRECVRDLPIADDGLCSFCRVIGVAVR
jgi:hypothetical protein